MGETKRYRFTLDGIEYSYFVFKREDFNTYKNVYPNTLGHAGIYIYFGKSGDYSNNLEDFYVGKSEILKNRIGQEHEDIEEWRDNYWENTVVFVPSRGGWDSDLYNEDEEIGDRYIDYVEYMFYWIARVVGNYNSVNNESPHLSDLDVGERETLNNFVIKAADVLERHQINLLKG